MSLVEDGRLELDAPVSAYLSRWQIPASEFDPSGVTARRLLSHTSGLSDSLGYDGFDTEQDRQSLEASLTRAADASPGKDGRTILGSEPGSGFAYSGGGYTLLQLMIEEMSGTAFPAFMHDRVFAPLGMERTTFDHAEALERSNRELNRFATVASHDLQEPLRKMAAFASLLRTRYRGEIDEEGVQCLDFLTDAAGRMRALIDDLLAYSRTSSRPLQRERVDLNALVETTREHLGLAIEESGAVIETGDLPAVTGDPLLLTLLFQNLLSNAIKYRGEAAPVIRIKAQARAETVEIAVADNGIGIEEKFFEKIFAPFQRLHDREVYEGTGIGLAVCQQAVERHGGTIEVASTPGEGTRFSFTLPLSGAEDAEDAA